ncbi:MAG: hypothetical protein KY444_06925 [Gemmatimonadetes bacterium]|nr:hypothetical protein [Gemmatimonadota bacterium]
MRKTLSPWLCLLLAACGPAVSSGSFVPEGGPQPRAKDAPVRIYQAARPDCAFEEIGMVRGWPRSGFDSVDEIFDAMRNRARAMGGDAIVGLTIQEQRGETVVVANGPVPVASSSGSTTYSGTVIRFADPSCAAAAENQP